MVKSPCEACNVAEEPMMHLADLLKMEDGPSKGISDKGNMDKFRKDGVQQSGGLSVCVE
jgi:hypothetical protein